MSTYLESMISKYSPKSLVGHQEHIDLLHERLRKWAGSCFLEILPSGSRAKGTAISLASDIDYVVSLSHSCNENKGGLESIYSGMYNMLRTQYGSNARKQNVSVRLTIDTLEIDVTPARKYDDSSGDHSLYLSKQESSRKTNISKHVNVVKSSGRIKEITLLKIWRELNKLDFPSIYLETLLIEELLKDIPQGDLETNFLTCLQRLASTTDDPLTKIALDPANTNNDLSELLTDTEKLLLKATAAISCLKPTWEEVVW